MSKESNERHIELCNKIEQQLAKVQAYVTTAKALDANWAHVGDAGYVSGKLQEILSFLNIEPNSDR